MSGYLSIEQVTRLLEGINGARVKQRDGMSHLEAYDIRRELTRVFGFGRWSARVTSMELIYERLPRMSKQSGRWVADEAGETRVYVGYRCGLLLRVHAPDGTLLAEYEEWAAGDASNFPLGSHAEAHDFAIKTAESQALKRCAVNLGDQFGLSLYAQGSRQPLVRWTLGPEGKEAYERLHGGDAQPAQQQAAEEHVPDESDPTVTDHGVEPAPDPRESNGHAVATGQRKHTAPVVEEPAAPADIPPDPPAPEDVPERQVEVDPPENPRRPEAQNGELSPAETLWQQAVAARTSSRDERVRILLTLTTQAIERKLATARLDSGKSLKAALQNELTRARTS